MLNLQIFGGKVQIHIRGFGFSRGVGSADNEFCVQLNWAIDKKRMSEQNLS